MNADTQQSFSNSNPHVNEMSGSLKVGIFLQNLAEMGDQIYQVQKMQQIYNQQQQHLVNNLNIPTSENNIGNQNGLMRKNQMSANEGAAPGNETYPDSNLSKQICKTMQTSPFESSSKPAVDAWFYLQFVCQKLNIPDEHSLGVLILIDRVTTMCQRQMDSQGNYMAQVGKLDVSEHD